MDSRELTRRERELLTFLLEALRPQAAALLPQLEGARVTVDENYDPVRHLDFELRPDAISVDIADGPLGHRAAVCGPDGEITGELFLYVYGGKLFQLQQAFYTDGPRTAMPDASSVRIEPDPPTANG